MIINDILKEKYEIQKRLSESSSSVNDYFKKAHESTLDFMNKYNINFKYGTPNNLKKESYTANSRA